MERALAIVNDGGMSGQKPTMPKTSQVKNRYPELLCEIRDALVNAFLGDGKPQDVAKRDAGLAVDALVYTFAGELIYIPRAALAHIDERHRRIQEEFTGENQRELARKYKHSIQHIYRIVKRSPVTQNQRKNDGKTK